MTNLSLSFTHPWFLLLLIPALVFSLWPHFRTNKKYRRNRNRIVSLVSHTLALVLAILLLAGLTFDYEIPNEKNELLLLVDVTESNEKSRDEKDEFVRSIIAAADKGFKVGVIKFGFDQVDAAELSTDFDKVFTEYLSAKDPDTSATNVEAALRHAKEKLTNPATGKIVVISDGIETDGAATSIIKSLVAEGTTVDTVCFPNKDENEVQILRVDTPKDNVVLGQSFKIGVTLQANKLLQTVKLTLRDNGVVKEDVTTEVQLTSKEQYIELDYFLEERGLHEFCVEISAPEDTNVKNNMYYTYMNLASYEHVLIIEKNKGESQALQGILQDTYSVVTYSIAEDLDLIPKTINEMCAFEQVVLVNVAHSDMNKISGFEELLNTYVYKHGGGLFTVGGENDVDEDGKPVPHMYNREDMEGSTYYKQMLPIITTDYTPPLAIMLVIDTSGSMSGDKLENARQGALAVLDALNDRDFCGVSSFADASEEKCEVIPVARREELKLIIENVGKGEGSDSSSGGTVFSDAIKDAGNALGVVDVDRKHIILVTDGNPSDTLEVYGEYIKNNMEKPTPITMSILTIHCDPAHIPNLEQAAEMGGGKFYNVNNSEINSIPTVMQNDLAFEATPEINYGEEFNLTIKDHTSVVDGILEEDIPMLSGYYGTMAKESADVVLFGKHVPIYAQWEYGAGKVGSFMSDLNGVWSEKFVVDPIGRSIINNIVNALFPAVAPTPDDIDYEVRVDNYTTHLSVYGMAEGEQIKVDVVPKTSYSGEDIDNVIVKAEEGNRRFSYDLKQPAIYEITIEKTDAEGNLISHCTYLQNFSYSQEYNEFPSRTPVGEEFMQKLAEGGKGSVITDPVTVYNSFMKTLKRNFDPRIVFLIIAIVSVLIDVAVRKFKFKWPHELVREYKAKKAEQREE